MDNPNRGHEQIVPTPSLTEAISHELTSHADKEALSAAIDAYESHYVSTNFGASVLRYTDIIATTDAMMRLDGPLQDPADETVSDQANAAFFRGAMLGLHTAMRFTGQRSWTKILYAEFGPNVEPVVNETRESFNDRICLSVLNQMDQLQQQVDVLQPEHKALLETAATRLYDEDDNLRRERFEIGMMYAMYTALQAATR